MISNCSTCYKTVITCTATVIHCHHHYHQGHAHLWFGCHISLCSICTGGGARQSILKPTSSSTAISFTWTFGELDNSHWCRWIATKPKRRNLYAYLKCSYLLLICRLGQSSINFNCLQLTNIFTATVMNAPHNVGTLVSCCCSLYRHTGLYMRVDACTSPLPAWKHSLTQMHNCTCSPKMFLHWLIIFLPAILKINKKPSCR